MDETRLRTIFQLQAFLAATVEVSFRVPDTDEARYAHIVSVAQRFGYARLNRPDKGVVLHEAMERPLAPHFETAYEMALQCRLARHRDGQGAPPGQVEAPSSDNLRSL